MSRLLAALFLLIPLIGYPDNRIKIGVVDTGIVITDRIYPYLCQRGHKDFTGATIVDRNGHGSMVAEVITQGLDPKEYCLIILKWYDSPRGDPGLPPLAINEAVDQGAKLINLSLSGTGDKPAERDAIQRAVDAGITVIVAAGNDHANLSDDCDIYPACYPIASVLYHVVSDYLKGHPATYANYGGPVNEIEDGRYEFNGRKFDGTSVAAAKVTNRILRQRGHLKNKQ